MGHVGKVVLLDLVQLLFRFFRFFGLLSLPAHLPDAAGGFFAYAADVAVVSKGYAQKQRSQQNPEQDGPNRGIPGRQYLDRNGFLCLCDGVAAVGYAYAEPVAAGRKMGEVSIAQTASSSSMSIGVHQ